MREIIVLLLFSFKMLSAQNDTLFITQDRIFQNDVNFNYSAVIIKNGANVVFQKTITIQSNTTFYISNNSLVTLISLSNYSQNFYNYGHIFFQNNIYNYGNIQSHGLIETHSNGRKIYNYGQINSLIGMGGPKGNRAYKIQEINNSPPTSGLNLPVEWGSYKLKSHNNNIQITWSIFSEINNNIFFILASENNVDWDTLTTIPSIGNHNNTIEYSYQFNNKYSGYKYIKIGQEDLNGIYSIGYEVIIHNILSGIEIFNHNNNLVFKNIPYNTVCTIFDSKGCHLFEKTIEEKVLTLRHIDLSKNSIYFIHFQYLDQKIAFKFLY